MLKNFLGYSVNLSVTLDKLPSVNFLANFLTKFYNLIQLQVNRGNT